MCEDSPDRVQKCDRPFHQYSPFVQIPERQVPFAPKSIVIEQRMLDASGFRGDKLLEKLIARVSSLVGADRRLEMCLIPASLSKSSCET